MKNLKKELFFKCANRNWFVLHYANEKFDLWFHFKNESIKNEDITFQLVDKNNQDICLRGLVIFHNEMVDFQYNQEESTWLYHNVQINHIENATAAIKKENITHLLDNIFCSMLIEGDSR